MLKAIVTCAVIQLGLGVPLVAQQTGITSLFPAAPDGFVTDAAHLLDNPTREALEARLAHLRSATGGEVAVVTLPTIGNYDPQQVALTIGRTWKVGPNAPIGDRRRNAGVVILVVPRTSDHGGQIRIETGQGTEGAISDARAGEIRDSMIPYLRAGNYGRALDVGTAMVADLVARDLGLQDSSLVRPRAQPATHVSRTTSLRFVFYLIIFVFWMISLAARARSRRGGGGGGGSMLTNWVLPYMIGRSFGGGGGFGGSGWGRGGGGGGFGGFGGGGGFSGGGAGGSF